MKRILVATDGSVSSTEAVQFGVELAAEHTAELIFVHVVPIVDMVPATGFGIGGAFPHEPTAEDSALLEDAAAVAIEHGVVATTALLRGDTVDEIVTYADNRDVDAIVVGLARPECALGGPARQRLQGSPARGEAAGRGGACRRPRPSP